MRIVTWNINGLGSLKFPFDIHAHHTHAYPAAQQTAAAASALSASGSTASHPLPPDDYDYDDQQQLHDDSTPSPPSPPLRTTDGAAEAVLLSPNDPSFPPFPTCRLLLTPRVISSYEQLLDYFDADIICLQEVKIARTKLELLSKAAFVAGYDAFFSFSRRRPGYSGVVTYTRSRTACPVAAEEGVTGTLPPVQSTVSAAASTAAALPASPPSSQQSSIGHNTAVLSTHSMNDLRELDSEGRCVITDHGSLLLFNVYVPNAGEERDEFKQRFLHLLQLRLRECQAAGRRVMLVGDINIAAARIDHAFPEPFTLEDGAKVAFEQSPSRLWWKENVSTQGGSSRSEQREDDDGRLVDAMRELHPQQRQAYTCWNTLTGARGGNHGARIDYVLTSASMLPAVLDCRLLSHVQGSDHCPVRCDLDAAVLRDWHCAAAPPSHASQYWTEFSGQQRKLSAFFRSSSSSSREPHDDGEKEVEDVEELLEGGTSAMQEREGRQRGDGSRRRPADPSFKPAASRLTKKRRATEKADKTKHAGRSLFAYFTSSPQQPRPAAANASAAAAAPSSPSSLDCSVVEIDAPLSLASAAVASAAEPLASSSPPPAGLSPSSASSASAGSFSRLFTQSSLSLRCPAHDLPAKLWTVNKKGANLGRKFFCCQLPPPGRCSFWKWHSDAVREHKEDERRRAAAAAGSLTATDGSAVEDAFITAGEHLALQKRRQQRS